MLTNITPTTFKARIVLVRSKPTRDKINLMPFVSDACARTIQSSNFSFAIFGHFLKKLPPIIKKPS